MKYLITISEKQYERIKTLYNNGFGSISDSIILNGKQYEERLHGEWIESKERKGHFYCSECVQEDPETGKWRETFDFKYPFCPNCGADMREGDAE